MINSNIGSIKRAFSYIRFSSKQQVQGDSLRRQLHSAQQYCNTHDIQLDNSSFRDLGVSAFKGHNLHEDSGLGQFLTACTSGKIKDGDFLIVESLDRMSRQHVQTALRQFLNILSHGITIVTLIDNRAYTQHSDTTDLIISITIMARAYEESATKAKRLKAAWYNKRERLQSGTAILKVTSLSPHWLTLSKDRSTWHVNKNKASIIQLIYDKSANGYGQHKLVQYLNENNYPAPRGNGWASSSIKRILTDKCVLGHYQPHEFIDGTRTPIGSVIEDYYTPIISEELYYRVQVARKQRTTKNSGNKGDKFTNLLQGLTTCGNCGANLHMIDKGKGSKGGKYLVCSVARKGGGCKYVSYRYDHVERSIIQQLLCEKHYHLLAGEPTDTTNINNEIYKLESKIEEANTRLKGFLKLVDDFTLPSVKESYKSQQEAIKSLGNSLESARGELANSTVPRADITAIFQLIADVMQTDLLAIKANQHSTDELYSLRIKLHSIISKTLGSVALTKEYIKQSDQWIHCVSDSLGEWSIQVGRGTKDRPLWYLAGWAE